MSKTTQAILGIVAVLAIAGAYFFPRAEILVQGISNPGSTFNNAKVAAITTAPASATATTSSLTNTDGTDREITDSFAACTLVGTSKTYLSGTGLTALTIQMSTSTAAGDAKINTNYAANFTVATSSPWSFASTTIANNDMSRVWPAGSILNMTFNATNTAACTVGVHYVNL